MKYNDIKKIIWFKEGIHDNDKVDIDKCIASLKEDLAVESPYFDFVKKYGSVVICESFHQYYKNNNIVFFINHNLITNLISMNNRNGDGYNKNEVERVFKVELLNKDQEINIDENVVAIQKRAKESDYFKRTDLYEFFKYELKDAMLEKEKFDETMTLANKILRSNLDKVIDKLKTREQFKNYSEQEKKEIIETMVYYSYINEIIFITNNLRTKFLGNIVVDDFVKSPMFGDYIALLLESSEQEKNQLDIFSKAPTGENLRKQITKDTEGKSHVNSVGIDLKSYNKAAVAQLRSKYKNPDFFTRVKKWLRKN